MNFDGLLPAALFFIATWCMVASLSVWIQSGRKSERKSELLLLASWVLFMLGGLAL